MLLFNPHTNRMNVIEFYNELALIAARYPRTEDNEWIFEMHLPKKRKEWIKPSPHILPELFEWLDLSKVQPLGHSFNKEIIEEDAYYWFGAVDTDRLLIDKGTGEVVSMSEDDELIYYLAANIEDYLSIFVAFSDYSIKGFFGYAFKEQDKHAMAATCLRIVRQEKYFPFYQVSFQ
jgi:hypothetical protein